MRFKDYNIVLQEVPNEVSLCFTITGCQIKCDGCHSPYLWKKDSGDVLTQNVFLSLLDKYRGLITCVLFMGGEWYETELIELLMLAKNRNLKTCLYTGLDDINIEIKNNLTYLKTGKWDKSLGGLSSKTTNQKFINIKSGEIMNFLFIK